MSELPASVPLVMRDLPYALGADLLMDNCNWCVQGWSQFRFVIADLEG